MTNNAHFILRRTVALLALIAMVSVACRREASFASWDVDVLVPMAKGELNMADFVKAPQLTAGPNGLLRVKATDTVLEVGLDTLIGIPDTTLKSEFAIPIGGVQWAPGVPFYRDTVNTTFDLKDVSLTSATVRSSLFTVEFTNDLKKQILARYRIISATSGGDTFELERLVPAKSTLVEDFDLNGYDLDLRGENGKKVNTIFAYVEAMIDPAETAMYTFSAGERFEIQNTFKRIIPGYAVGYFGQQSVTYADTTLINVFQSVGFQHLDITEFDVELTIDNGIGADLMVTMARLGSFNTASGAEADLAHTMIGTPQQFGRAINLFDPADPVKHIRKSYSFRQDNSNLDALIELQPDGLRYDLSLGINPLGNVSLGNDFVYYGHNLSAVMDIDVPLTLGVGGLMLTDTFDLSLDTSAWSNGPVNAGEIRGRIDNGYPFTAAVQLYFLDDNLQVLDSLHDGSQRIDAAEVNTAGKVTSSVRSEVVVGFDRTKIERIRQASRVKVVMVFDTYQQAIAEIRDDYRVNFVFVASLNVQTP